MYKAVNVRNITIGEGIPKICVPIVEETRGNIVKEAEDIIKRPIDLIEWRADWYEDVNNLNSVKETAILLREVVKDIPILFTYRSKKEGGNREITVDEYLLLNQAAIDSGVIDLIDVELFIGNSIVENLIEYAHQKGCKVIASNHDFNKTPEKTELVSRLTKMQELGADIAKIAVMPCDRKDVLELLDATITMNEISRVPIITMSMAGSGLISRMSGELFGSSLTFASAKKASAPGQIPIEELHHILHVLHDNLIS